MLKILAVATLISLVVTMGCGFAISFGGESFKSAVKGHMVLGMITFVLMLALVVTVFKR